MHHFQATSLEASDLHPGGLGKADRRAPGLFPKTLMGQNQSPGLITSPRVCSSGSLIKGGHNSKDLYLVLALPLISCMGLGQ